MTRSREQDSLKPMQNSESARLHPAMNLSFETGLGNGRNPWSHKSLVTQAFVQNSREPLLDIQTSTLILLASSGFASHLSGNRFAAPAESEQMYRYE